MSILPESGHPNSRHKISDRARIVIYFDIARTRFTNQGMPPRDVAIFDAAVGVQLRVVPEGTDARDEFTPRPWQERRRDRA